MNGQPCITCIRGMRLTVRRVVEAVALYPDWEELQSEYPELEKEDICQALQFSTGNLDDLLYVNRRSEATPQIVNIQFGSGLSGLGHGKKAFTYRNY